MRQRMRIAGMLATIIIITNLGPPIALASQIPTGEVSGDVVITGSGSNPTNKNITLTVKAEDVLSGVKKITMPDETVIEQTETTYNVTENGVYKFTVEDNAGNITVGEVSITGIDKIDPVIETTVEQTSPTNKPVIIKYKVTDQGSSGFDKVELPDGNISTEPEGTYVAKSNGTYKFVAYDKAMNSSEKEVIINNINNVLPIVTLEEYDRTWTNKDVIVKAKTDKGTLEKETHTFTENGTYTFKAEDEFGNVGILDVEIKNIDKNKPTSPTVDVTTGTPVVKSGIDKESGIKENRFTIETGGEVYKFVENIKMKDLPKGDFIIVGVSEDNAGNISDESKLNVRWDGTTVKEIDDEVVKEDEAGKAVRDARDSLNKTKPNPTKPHIDETQNKIDVAVDLIGDLASGEEKNKLDAEIKDIQKELDELKKDIEDRIKEIEKDIEELTTPEGEKAIQDKIDKLPEGEDKDRLEKDLKDKVKEINDKDHEESQNDIKNQIKKLHQESNDNILSLQDKFDNKIIGETQTKLDKSSNLITKVDDTDKDKIGLDTEQKRLQTELDKIKKAISDLIKEIEDEIKDITDPSKGKDIQDKIDKLPESKEKDDLKDKLQDKLDELTETTNQDQLVNNIKKKLEAMEEKIDMLYTPPKKTVDKLKDDLSNINKDIDRVTNPIIKEELQNKHDELLDKLDKIKTLEDSNWGGGGTPNKPVDPNKPVIPIDPILPVEPVIPIDPWFPIKPKPEEPKEDDDIFGDTNGGEFQDGVLSFGNGSTTGNSEGASGQDKELYTEYQRTVVDRIPYTLKKDSKVDWNELVGLNIRNLAVNVDTKIEGKNTAEISVFNHKMYQEVGVISLPDNALQMYHLPNDEQLVSKLNTVVNKGYVVGNSQGNLLLDSQLTVLDGLTSFDRFTVDHELYERVTGRTVIDDKTREMSNNWYMNSFKSGLGLFKEEQIDSLIGENIRRTLLKGEVADMVYNIFKTDITMAGYNPTLNGQNIQPEYESMAFCYNLGVFEKDNGVTNYETQMTRTDLVNVLYKLDEITRQRLPVRQQLLNQ